MDCAQARQLFDAYLDGELSAQLKTEVGAHCLRCATCRHALALQEVTHHILVSDQDSARLGADFTDRLLVCLDRRPRSWTVRLQRALYVAGPLAAAAVVTLAFLGFFEPAQQVAGQRDDALVLVPKTSGAVSDAGTEAPSPRQAGEILPEDLLAVEVFAEEPAHPTQALMDAWAQQLQRSLAEQRAKGDSLKQGLDQTILQLLDVLRSSQQPGADHYPGSDADPALAPASGVDADRPVPDDDVEDL